MSSYDFEQDLRDRMRERAAVIDRTISPAAPLRTLLAARSATSRARMSARLGIALAVATVAAATVAVLALATISGPPLSHGLAPNSPLSSVTPSARPPITTLAPTPSPSTEPSEPTKSPPPTVSAGVLKVAVASAQGDASTVAIGGGPAASLWR
jgi:hypothetical protein